MLNLVGGLLSPSSLGSRGPGLGLIGLDLGLDLGRCSLSLLL